MADSHASSRHATEGEEAQEAAYVLLPLPLDRTYAYRIPPGGGVQPGDFVRVPLGRRPRIGVVWGEEGDEVAPEKLKDVSARLDAPPLPAELRRFVDWVAAYTLSPRGSVLKMAVSVPSALEPPRPRSGYVRGGTDPHPAGARMTAARRRVLAAAGAAPRTARDLAARVGASPAVVRGLAQAGLLKTTPFSELPALDPPDGERPGPVLSPAQAAAAHELAVRVEARRFAVVLLDGVTGSGKTEVYFEGIAAALRARRQVLVLLPEIALTAQWLDRFRARFGAPPAAWHSELSPAKRRLHWRAVATGEARVVVGARSALFLPFPELGLIVVDEEHDASYKQEEGVVYHARDMAIVRAREAGVPAVLSSATPSLETVANVHEGRYARLTLPERHGGAVMPEVLPLDLRRHPPDAGRWLSPVLVEALDHTFRAGEQAMLFLNRRGYAPLTLCRRCGHRFSCPSCTAWLVEHRSLGILQCHHCGFREPFPSACPACGGEGALVPCGPGVERLAEEVAARFPGVSTATMTSDTVTGPESARRLVLRMEERDIDLLIGTQLVAKGHHFPFLTLVGVVDADLGLTGGDLRAGERTYQVLAQVAGRAGRARRPGRVFLQTHQPDHPVIRALVDGNREKFLAAEAAARRAWTLPPYGRLAALIVSGPVEAEVDGAARRLGLAAPRADGIEVLGPAPAPLAVLRGRHRRRFLVRARKDVALQPALRDWLASVGRPRRVRVQVDIDPYSFL